MRTKSPRAIRLAVNSDVDKALRIAKLQYPALSDAEILKIGLSKIVNESKIEYWDDDSLETIKNTTARSVGLDYLTNPEEDRASKELLKKHGIKG